MTTGVRTGFSCELHHDCFSCKVSVDKCPNWEEDVKGGEIKFKRNPITNDELLRMRDSGYKLKEASQLVGMSGNAIRCRIGSWTKGFPTREEVLAMNGSGMSQKQVAKFFGHDVSSLHDKGLFNGWVKQGVPKLKIDFAIVEEMLQEGKSQAKVSRMIGVAPQVLSRRLKRYRRIMALPPYSQSEK